MKKLISLLLIKNTIIFFVILSCVIGIGPDEAQYWTWSQELDFGYYSKPPGIAWVIWFGTQIFGQTEIGVRFCALVLSSLIAFSVYYLARCCLLNKETAFLAAAAFAVSPIGILGSILATTDAGLLLFWTLSCSQIAKGLSNRCAPNYIVLGLLIAMGALFKWPIYIFWIFVFFVQIVEPSMRSRQLFVGVLVSLIGLLPTLYWNIGHDFATFQHVFSTIKGGHAHTASSGNSLDFIGAQVALISPVFFILMIFCFYHLISKRKTVVPAVQFCGAISLILLLVYTFLATRQKIQGNWAVFAYPSAVVCISWYADSVLKHGVKWMKFGLFVSVSLTTCALILPFTDVLPFKSNPLKHNLGWKRLNTIIKEAGYHPDKDFLFADTYQISSLLSFYAPKQKRAHFLNLQGVRKNQFYYWKGMQELQLGKDGYFVIVENSPHLGKFEDTASFVDSLRPFFSHLEVVGVKDLAEKKGSVVKQALIIKGYTYNGKQPLERSIY